MLEIILILSLGWLSYEEHERAVEAEVALSVSRAEAKALREIVKVWDNKNVKLEESNEKYEQAIREIARENAEQKVSLEQLNSADSRTYLESRIPDDVLEWASD